MRLRSCVAVELLVGALMAAGIGGLTVWGYLWLDAELARPARAATVRPLGREPVPPPVSPRTELTPPTQPIGLFNGVSDDVLLAPLRTGNVTQAKFNHGGSSVSLRLDFDNGSRAAFKPRQINTQSQPRREIAAFRINRLLGLSAVPPAVGRQLPLSVLLERLHPESEPDRPRIEAEIVADDGIVDGELSWWIPVIKKARLGGFEIDSTEGVVTWKRYLTVGSPIPRRERHLVAQISDMLLFDFVINNSDRWSGGNARVSEDGRQLYFMDNTLSFGPDRNGHVKARTYFQRCQRFSRSLVSRLRHLGEDEVRRAVKAEIGPFDLLLEEREIEALMSRRDLALEYIDQLIEVHGADAVLVFP